MRREALGFAIGSVFFFVGAMPWYANAVGAVGANATFAVGSIFFTTAGAITLLLSGRKPPKPGTTRGDFLDWWAAAIQLAGTVLFNVSTFRALAAAIDNPDAVGVGWRADAWGSAAFLVASGLALGALARRHELWDLHARTPASVWLNMAGAIAFAASAIGAYVVPATDDLLSQWWANAGTIAGAACFFLAAVMTRPGVLQPAPASGNAP